MYTSNYNSKYNSEYKPKYNSKYNNGSFKIQFKVQIKVQCKVLFDIQFKVNSFKCSISGGPGAQPPAETLDSNCVEPGESCDSKGRTLALSLIHI